MLRQNILVFPLVISYVAEICVSLFPFFNIKNLISLRGQHLVIK